MLHPDARTASRCRASDAKLGNTLIWVAALSAVLTGEFSHAQRTHRNPGPPFPGYRAPCGLPAPRRAGEVPVSRGRGRWNSRLSHSSHFSPGVAQECWAIPNFFSRIERLRSTCGLRHGCGILPQYYSGGSSVCPHAAFTLLSNKLRIIYY